MDDITVYADGWLDVLGQRLPCALGHGGVAAVKREGDGVTPAGRFPLRRLYYRPDRVDRPVCGLETVALSPDDGWCDDPADAAYNRPVLLPHAASHERLWRWDGLYDLIVPLGYNDEPTIAGAGSAIFLHIAQPDFSPTEGCVALARADLLAILAKVGPGIAFMSEQWWQDRSFRPRTEFQPPSTSVR
mgnify:CR=1 FL=1